MPNPFAAAVKLCTGIAKVMEALNDTPPVVLHEQKGDFLCFRLPVFGAGTVQHRIAHGALQAATIGVGSYMNQALATIKVRTKGKYEAVITKIAIKFGQGSRPASVIHDTIVDNVQDSDLKNIEVESRYSAYFEPFNLFGRSPAIHQYHITITIP